jgi:hypothetical protein
MKGKLTNKAIKRSVLLIGLVSIFQPYIVLITEYGRSNECWNCLIIEQTFMTSLIYLFLPLLAIYLLLKQLGANSFLIGLIVAVYFVPVSIVKITVPLFDDRIASWSTFSDQEVWDYAISMSIPSMGLLACLIVAALGIFNKEPSLIHQK